MKTKLIKAWDTVAWFAAVAMLTALSGYGAMELINNESSTVSAVIGVVLSILLVGKVLIKPQNTNQ